MKDKPPIWIGVIAEKAFVDKFLEVSNVQDALNEQIDLSAYGAGVQSLNFIPIALQPTNINHEEKIAYDPQKKEVHIHLKMDYDAVESADLSGFMNLVALLFLSGIDQFPWKKVRDFDWKRFKEDVAGVFVERGWLMRAELG